MATMARHTGKLNSAKRTVTQASMDNSWTAFVPWWNTEKTFAELIKLREEQRQRYSLAEPHEVVF